MENGAFALMDCLGFKGIWKRYDHNESSLLITKLRSLSERAENAVKKHRLPKELKVDDIEPKVKLLSDTVVVSLSSTEISDSPHNELITMTAIVLDLIDLYIKDKPHLPLRGCIAYGEHITEQNFLIGPVVDNAAEYMNSAQGAFVWFLPPASHLLDCFITSQCKDALLVAPYLRSIYEMVCPKYPVPIKKSHYLTTRTVNPISYKSDEEADSIIQLYMDAMKGDTIDIWTKSEQTLKYLEHCKGLNREVRDAEKQLFK